MTMKELTEERKREEGSEQRKRAEATEQGKRQKRLNPSLMFDYLESIDSSLRTIKRIAIWFLVLSILGLVVGFFAVLLSH